MLPQGFEQSNSNSEATVLPLGCHRFSLLLFLFFFSHLLIGYLRTIIKLSKDRKKSKVSNYNILSRIVPQWKYTTKKKYSHEGSFRKKLANSLINYHYCGDAAPTTHNWVLQMAPAWWRVPVVTALKSCLNDTQIAKQTNAFEKYEFFCSIQKVSFFKLQITLRVAVRLRHTLESGSCCWFTNRTLKVTLMKKYKIWQT